MPFDYTVTPFAGNGFTYCCCISLHPGCNTLKLNGTTFTNMCKPLRSLKKERIRKRIYKTRDLSRADIFDYIEVFYNRPDATTISAASALRPSDRLRREDRLCLQSITHSANSSRKERISVGIIMASCFLQGFENM